MSVPSVALELDLAEVSQEAPVAWAIPKHSPAEVDEAGAFLIDDTLISEEDFEEALQIINNWRSSHSFPLNTFQVTLRRNARQIDPNSLVAQRIKRLSSIDATCLSG
ncbi:MAG: hypothetical protein ACREMB_10610 [Candidatus Rokuibacteriota bacterium]